MLRGPPDGVLLVARLRPASPSGAAWVRPGQESRLVATASLSFDPCCRDTFATLQPPAAEAYLCNVAVDVSFRRQGHAARMLAACEALCAALGFARLYLHVRLGDGPARALYDAAGFAEVDADSWLVKVRGIVPRALMVKEVR
jgi:GNAT superfamily N-acetyltransferase